jgi:hypothetical protein
MANKKVAYGLVLSALVVMALAFTASQQTFGAMHGAVPQISYKPLVNGTVNTTFIESGLPRSAVFKVTYDNITENTTVVNVTNTSLVFATPAGNYLATGHNSIVGNTVYFPTPASATVAAGGTYHVRYSR